MAVANLPTVTTGKPADVATQAQVDAIVAALSVGLTPYQLAKKLHPHDRSSRRVAARRLEAIALNDDRVGEQLMAQVRFTMLAGLGPATRALVSRASSRNVQAIKLLYEATGVHNPRVKHEHSGEISIKFDIPRPTFEGSMADADVVE